MACTCYYVVSCERDCLMGPWSEERQYQRAQAIARVLAQPDLDEDMRRIWDNHLRNLSRSEAQYNARVRQIYTEMRNRHTRSWMT